MRRYQAALHQLMTLVLALGLSTGTLALGASQLGARSGLAAGPLVDGTVGPGPASAAAPAIAPPASLESMPPAAIDSTRAAAAASAMAAAAAPAGSEARAAGTAGTAGQQAGDQLSAYRPRFGRSRPLVAVVAENYYTELADYVLPYGVLRAAGVADVRALATQPGPIRMFPAPLQVEPQATTAQFDQAHPEGADYVIVPAVHKDDDPALLAWVRAQASKGATIVGVCDGVWVLARAGLLDGRRATGHWYSRDDLRKKFPQVHWQRNLRYVEDRGVITTTGVSATIPVSLALVEAIAGPERALRLARELGGADMGWSAEHHDERFQMSWKHKLTIGGNAIAFWSHEDVGIPVDQGVDEIALALKAEVYSATYRSTAYTVAPRPGKVLSRRGLSILPDRVMGVDAPRRMLSAPDADQPLASLDQALKGIAKDYGPRTAAWVALQMEYPGESPGGPGPTGQGSQRGP